MEFLKKLFRRKDQNSATPEDYQVFFTCDGCFGAIEDGDQRYNCVDCVKSYDLCQKCYSSGLAEAHTSEMGHHHWFVAETQSHTYASTLVLKGESLEHLIFNMFRFFGERPAVGQYDRDEDIYAYLTFNELFESVKLFSSGLKKLVLDRGCSQSMVSMCSISRLEWYLTDLACLLLSIPTVPMGANSNKDQMRYILKKAEVNILVCSSSTLGKLVEILPDCPTVHVVIIMDAALKCSEGLESCDVKVPHHVHLMKFTEVMALGKHHPTDLLRIKHKPTEIYTVQFTSGSTGDPKGCVFTRSTWRARVAKGTILGRLNVWLSFHPPSHNLERGSFFATLLSGGKIGIYRGSMEHLFDDFALVRPTIVASTPRLWTMLYNQYLQELHEAYIQYQTEGKSAATGTEKDSTPVPVEPTDVIEDGDILATDTGNDAELQSLSASTSGNDHFNVGEVPAELRKEVMSRFKSKLGGRERMITTGGAPTGKLVKRFIIECFDGMVNEGYGSTEVGGIASEGSVLRNADVKLIDAPEMGYFTTDNPPRGEICVKTPAMVDGYFKSPEITAEKFVDGYFLTGDIGVMEGDKVRIIDRRKNMFKLAQGEFVSPERLEALYVGASYCISQMYVYGNSLQSNILAVVVPEPEEILKLGKTLYEGNKGDLSELCHSSEVKRVLMKELQMISEENSLPGWEIPVGVLLEPQPFSVENGLLTSTFKKNRPKLEQRYRALLEEMYDEFNDSNMHRRPLEIVVFEWLRKQLHHNAGISEPVDKPQDGVDYDMIQKSFSQLGGDSLAAMHLSSLLREHLSLELPVDIILKTPLAKIMDGVKMGEMSVGVVEEYDWAKEVSSIEQDFCQQCPLSDVPEVSSSVLLTGCTGFLGRFILWELLQDTQISRIYCLAQNKRETSAKDRIMKTLDQLCLEFSCDDIKDRVGKLTVVVGDLSEPRLGLSADDYTILCEKVDTIIHNGATVNSVLPYLALKKCNVESTKELIRLAVTTKSKFLHYVSTIGVFSPMDSCNKVDESVKPSVGGLCRLSGYSQSKWVAESLVMAAISQGKLAGNISRPGLIGPHMNTGHANLRDWVYLLVKGLVKLGMVPTGQGCEGKQIHWVPVNQAAKAIALISTDHRGWRKDEKGNIFHLVNSSSPVTFNALTDRLMASHIDIKATSYSEFRHELSRRSKLSGDEVLGSLDLLLPRDGGWPNSPVYYSETCKVAKLEGAGIHMGQLHDRYLDKYLESIMFV